MDLEKGAAAEGIVLISNPSGLLAHPFKQKTNQAGYPIKQPTKSIITNTNAILQSAKTHVAAAVAIISTNKKTAAQISKPLLLLLLTQIINTKQKPPAISNGFIIPSKIINNILSRDSLGLILIIKLLSLILLPKEKSLLIVVLTKEILLKLIQMILIRKKADIQQIVWHLDVGLSFPKSVLSSGATYR